MGFYIFHTGKTVSSVPRKREQSYLVVERGRARLHISILEDHSKGDTNCYDKNCT